jgi:hypothetical protein
VRDFIGSGAPLFFLASFCKPFLRLLGPPRSKKKNGKRQVVCPSIFLTNQPPNRQVDNAHRRCGGALCSVHFFGNKDPGRGIPSFGFPCPEKIKLLRAKETCAFHGFCQSINSNQTNKTPHVNLDRILSVKAVPFYSFLSSEPELSAAYFQPINSIFLSQ